MGNVRPGRISSRQLMFFVVAVAAVPTDVWSDSSDVPSEQPPLAPCTCGSSTETGSLIVISGMNSPSYLTHSYQTSSDGQSCYEVTCNDSNPNWNFAILSAQQNPVAKSMREKMNIYQYLDSVLAASQGFQCTPSTPEPTRAVEGCNPGQGLSGEQVTAVLNAAFVSQPLPSYASPSCSPWVSQDGKTVYMSIPRAVPVTGGACTNYINKLKQRRNSQEI